MVTTATPNPTIPREAVEKAVKALLKWKDCNSKSEKPQLFGSDEFLYLVVTLKKIPPKGRTNPHKIPLKHPLFSAAHSSELCLFLDDRPDRRPTSKDAKAKLASEGIPVSKVIKLSKLKSDYKAFEAKRKLLDSYDLFLADRRIIPLLPKLLGKHFFQKKKLPVPVDLENKNWKEQVERVCSSAFLHLKTGTCSTVRVARVSMSIGDIVENVLAVINGVAETVPKKWNNVRSLNLKFSDSVALPIYQSVPEVNLKLIGLESIGAVVEEKKKKRRREEGGEDVVSSKMGSKGSSKKGRIHEVRYMDDVIEMLVSDEELDEEKNNDDELDVDVDDTVDGAEPEVELPVPEPKKSAKSKKGKQLKAKGKKETSKVELGEADRAKMKKASEVRKVSNAAKSVSAKKPKRS